MADLFLRITSSDYPSFVTTVARLDNPLIWARTANPSDFRVLAVSAETHGFGMVATVVVSSEPATFATDFPQVFVPHTENGITFFGPSGFSF